MRALGTTRNGGYVALISVLTVGAVGVMVVTGVLLLGLAWSRTSFTTQQSFQAKALADACAEEALQQIRNFVPFTGIGTLTFGQGSCDYSVISQGAQNRTVTARGFVESVVRKVNITLDKISPAINITSWQEAE